jgi:hypothetical protein
VINTRFTYAAAANSTTNGVALGAADEDIFVHKLIIGTPVASGTIKLYNKTVAFATDTSDIAFKIALPATLTSSHEYPYETVYTFEKPLQLNGGNLMVDQAMLVTVIWEPASEASAQN